MKILIISNTCSENEFKKLQEIKFLEKISPQQNYFSMLIEGLLENDETEIICFTARAIAESNTNIKSLSSFIEKKSERLSYIYTKVIAKNFIRNINNYCQMKKKVKKYLQSLNNNEEVFAIIDPLAFDITVGAISALKNIKKIALVTDIPMFITAIQKEKRSIFNTIRGEFKQKIFMRNINNMNGFCFLTESMNIINLKKKPFCVIEGMIPSIATEQGRNNKSLNNKKIVMYAGGLYEKFGIIDLINAATEISDEEFELHLYGEGNCIEYIKKIEKDYSYIKYKGVVGVNKIKSIERNAGILINPRPNHEEYTKYSFPSKTLEYMSSGRPVLTTKLGGIPDEYFKYLYVIKNNGKEGIKQALLEVLNLSDKELNDKGNEAFQFAKKEKNTKRQAGKLIGLMKGL